MLDARLGARKRRAGARVGAVAERDVLAGVGAVDVELVGVLEAARVAVRGAVEHHHRRARGDVDAADGGRRARQAEVALDRALVAQRLLDEVRDAIAVGREAAAWSSGCSPRICSAAASRRTVVSCPAANRLAATRTTSMTSGIEPSGNVAVASPVRTSSRGLRRRSST